MTHDVNEAIFSERGVQAPRVADVMSLQSVNHDELLASLSSRSKR